MKAIMCTKYGPPEVLQLKELPKPEPRDDQVRIRVRATAVTSSDCIVRGFKIPIAVWLPARLVLGIRRPRKILGMALAGDIDAVGRDVKSFKEGDHVFGLDPFAFGAYAEYKCMPERGALAAMPSNLTYEEGATIPYGGMLGLHFLRKGRVRSGQKVLIYGASGAVGTSAVQLAKHFGAEVVGVCSSTNFGLASSLGADAVIDYRKEDFTKKGYVYDLIFIAVGNRVYPPRREECNRTLAEAGAYVSVDRGRPKLPIENLLLLKQLAETAKLKPVIDRSYPLDQIVEAHRYVDTGHKRGNVVITVD
jgi:NADPH:quinone reductase-like Zn-dependent oxidoreductase